MPPVGPSLPPQLAAKRKRSEDNDDDSPSSPPTKIQAASPNSKNDQRRVIGPALPPASILERPSAAADEDEESSEDDDFGPSLPSVTRKTSDGFERREPNAAEIQAATDVETKKLQREDWMLAPPTDADWGSRADPTRLKNRKFASGRNVKAPPDKSGISTIWTETPEQKRQRLEDEVLGRKEASTSGKPATKSKKDDAETEATARRIQEYNNKIRGPSLYEQHRQSAGREEEDDPSKRAFDKEKDMGLGRIGNVQKKDMLKRASDFGSRFERGSFL